MKEKEETKEHKEEQEDEVEGDKEQDTALPMKNLLRGTLVVGVIAAYIVGILMLGRRR